MSIIYVHNPVSGEIHRWQLVDGVVLSGEACNADDMKVRDHMDEGDALKTVAEDSDRKCAHCWPALDGPEHVTNAEPE